MYTSIKQVDIHTLRALNGLFGVAFSDALSDTTPLYRLISRHVDEQSSPTSQWPTRQAGC